MEVDGDSVMALCAEYFLSTIDMIETGRIDGVNGTFLYGGDCKRGRYNRRGNNRPRVWISMAEDDVELTVFHEGVHHAGGNEDEARRAERECPVY